MQYITEAERRKYRTEIHRSDIDPETKEELDSIIESLPNVKNLEEEMRRKNMDDEFAPAPEPVTDDEHPENEPVESEALRATGSPAFGREDTGEW